MSQTSKVRTHDGYSELTFVTSDERLVVLKEDTYAGELQTGRFQVNPQKWAELDVTECIQTYSTMRMFVPPLGAAFTGSSKNGKYMQFDNTIVDWHGRLVDGKKPEDVGIVDTSLKEEINEYRTDTLTVRTVHFHGLVRGPDHPSGVGVRHLG